MEKVSDTSERAKQSKALPDNENDYTGPNTAGDESAEDNESSESDEDYENNCRTRSGRLNS
jgi:hypothetical protein